MTPRHAAALALVGWYLMIPPVFSPMGNHPRSFNDLSAPPNKWDIWAKFDSESACEKEKEHLRTEAPSRLKFAREHPDQDGVEVDETRQTVDRTDEVLMQVKLWNETVGDDTVHIEIASLSSSQFEVSFWLFP